MQISCSSLFLWEFDVETIVDILHKAGITWVEFWAETPDFWLKRDNAGVVHDLAQALSRLDGCTLHAPILDLNPSSYNDYVSELTLHETLWSLELASKIGAEIVTIHPGNRTVHRTPTTRDLEKFKHYLKTSLKRATELGLTLALENLTPKKWNICTTPEEIKSEINEFEGLMFTFDIMHALTKSLDHALPFIELTERMVNIHVGSVWKGTHHLPLHISRPYNHTTKNYSQNEEHDEAVKILHALKNAGYDGILTIEINDLVYKQPLSQEEKVAELISEREYIEELLQL